MELILNDRFFKQMDFDHKEESVHIVFEKGSSGSIQIFLKEEVEKVDLSLEAKEYSYSKIFVQNLSTNPTKINVYAKVEKDASIRFGILDLEAVDLDTEVRGLLLQEGATLEVYTGQSCNKEGAKKSKVQILHESPHTYGNMHNFAVVFDEGNYEMVADGTIRNGCFGSESHQETRVLTMGERHKALVIPGLYIDENDVKASHALTIGQPDANQLYYLQSRGLTKEQAMGLLSIGYFMPVIDLVEDETLHDQLREEMERKVGLYGH